MKHGVGPNASLAIYSGMSANGRRAILVAKSGSMHASAGSHEGIAVASGCPKTQGSQCNHTPLTCNSFAVAPIQILDPQTQMLHSDQQRMSQSLCASLGHEGTWSIAINVVYVRKYMISTVSISPQVLVWAGARSVQNIRYGIWIWFFLIRLTHIWCK